MPSKAGKARAGGKSPEAEALRAIGARIAQARRENNGMTQHELAQRLKITETSVSNLERGVYSPYRYMGLLEKILKRDKAWFLHGEDGHPAGELEPLLTRLSEQNSEIMARLDHLLSILESSRKGKSK